MEWCCVVVLKRIDTRWSWRRRERRSCVCVYADGEMSSVSTGSGTSGSVGCRRIVGIHSRVCAGRHFVVFEFVFLFGRSG